jgi:hypothetical protein
MIVGILISTSVVTALVLYRHNKLMIDYIVSDDYSCVTNAHNEEQTFSRIEKLPDSIDEEFGGVLWEGVLENDKSKTVNCYKYEYNKVSYLKVEINDNKLIDFSSDNNNCYYIFYYVENI